MSMAIFTENKQTPKNCSLTNMVTHKNRKILFTLMSKDFLYRHTQDFQLSHFTTIASEARYVLNKMSFEFSRQKSTLPIFVNTYEIKKKIFSEMRLFC